MLDDDLQMPDDPDDLKDLVTRLTAEVKTRDLLIAKLEHQLAGHRRHRFGTKSETLDQLQLRLEDEEVAAARDEKPTPSERDVSEEGSKPKRRPLPPELLRNEEVLSPGETCACGGKLRKLGEDVSEELEYIPGRFVVNRIVRPRLACSRCEAIVQAPLPSRPIERGRPGPGLLAHVLVSKYADHLPLYRQSGIYEREGIDLDRSTLSDWVGRSTRLLEPLADEIGRHVRAGAAIFADDTPIKMQAKVKCATARLWTYVRDERPWNSQAPPAAWYRFSTDRKGTNPTDHLTGFEGWMHADGYTGFNELYRGGDVQEVACMAHIRRKFVEVFQNQGSSIAEEAIKRIASLYAVEKAARGLNPEARVELRRERAKPILDDLETWLIEQLSKVSAKSDPTKAIRYALSRLKRLRPYLDNGQLEIDNNAAERAIKPIALGRKNYLFIGSKGGGNAAATAYTLIETAKLNGIDPQAWLTDVLARIQDHKISRLDELLPWRYADAPK